MNGCNWNANIGCILSRSLRVTVLFLVYCEISRGRDRVSGYGIAEKRGGGGSGSDSKSILEKGRGSVIKWEKDDARGYGGGPGPGFVSIFQSLTSFRDAQHIDESNKCSAFLSRIRALFAAPVCKSGRGTAILKTDCPKPLVCTKPQNLVRSYANLLDAIPHLDTTQPPG